VVVVLVDDELEPPESEEEVLATLVLVPVSDALVEPRLSVR
jgi:hypothetical protein